VLLDPRGQLIDSYFGASCGGETASIAALWGTAPVQYLQSARDEFCASGPHAHWTDQISRADLLRALQADSRTDVGHHLDQIAVTKHDDSGRAEFITITGEQQKVVRGWDFKLIVGRTLGWNILKSSRFEVSRNGSSFVFRGSGFGHGLGLCQEGAHVMATRGANYQRILEKYFPGTRVGRNTGTSGQVGTDTGTRGRGDAENVDVSARWQPDLLIASPHVSISASPLPRVSASRFITISSEHFRVTYPADIDRRDANQVLTILESARADYLRRAGNTSSPPVLDIRINESTGDFTDAPVSHGGRQQRTKGNKIELQPVAILKRPRRVEYDAQARTRTRHYRSSSVMIAAPRWLEEGFAIYLAGEGASYSHGSRGMLSEEELEKRLEHPTSQAGMRAAYADAYLKVKEMIRNGGESSVWKKLAAQ
jgi:hypothetical protein